MPVEYVINSIRSLLLRFLRSYIRERLVALPTLRLWLTAATSDAFLRDANEVLQPSLIPTGLTRYTSYF